MGLNLDIDTGYTPWGERPTEEELKEIEKAKFILRQIGRPAVIGYTDDMETALGKGLFEAMTNMLAEGIVIDVRDPEYQIELRIGKDRKSTLVQRMPIAQELDVSGSVAST